MKRRDVNDGLKRIVHRILSTLVFGLVLMAVSHSQILYAQEQQTGRAISAAFEYPGIELSTREPFSVGIILLNRGTTDENLQFLITGTPKDWNASIRSDDLTVTGVFLPAGEERTLNFNVFPPPIQIAGRYDFRLLVSTADRTWTEEENLRVSIKEKSAVSPGSGEIGLTTAYPILRGPAEVSYEFTLELENKRDDETTFDLFMNIPEGWEGNFKPVYEPRYISSFQIKGRLSKKLVVEVKPPRDAPAGEYPVLVQISSDTSVVDLPLNIVITGTYEISLNTASGSLSMGAIRGKQASIDLFIKNTGTAVQSHIGMFSYNPENWDVRFEPEAIDGLMPGQTQVVRLMIEPYGRALVGDYSVEIRANGDKVSEPLEFRVTVNASAAFGWIGLAIIILVIGGLVLLFLRLGRR